MGKYFRMADVFKVGVSDAGIKVRQNYIVEGVDDSFKPMEYATHAINSHDELVENMQHYKQEAEQWEARATKAASRAQDLEVEVERLRVIIDIKPMANRYNNDIDDFDNEIIMSGV